MHNLIQDKKSEDINHNTQIVRRGKGLFLYSVTLAEMAVYSVLFVALYY